MNRLSLSFLAVLFAAFALLGTGCGEQPKPPDPQVVLDSALSRESLLANPDAEATADVESLGDQDRVLEGRAVPISPEVFAQIKNALVQSGAQPGKGRQGPPVVENLKSGDSTEIDGVEVNRVSGDLDVKTLVNGLEGVAGISDGKGNQEIQVPGLSELTKFEDTITRAHFDLYAQKDDGSLQSVELTLTLDNGGSALPPTRIRFRVSEKQTD